MSLSVVPNSREFVPAIKCANCGSSIPTGNISCFICGTTIPMDEAAGDKSLADYTPSLAFVQPSKPALAIVASSPQKDSAAREIASDLSPKPFPLPRRVVETEQKEEQRETDNRLRKIGVLCVLLVVCLGVAIVEFRSDMASYWAHFQETFFPAQKEVKQQPAPPVAPAPKTGPTTPPAHHATSAASVTEVAPAPATAAPRPLQVRVTGQTGAARSIPATFTAFPSNREVGVAIGERSTPEAMPTADQLVSPMRVEVSPRESLNMVLKRVAPQYPPAARAAHIQGAVVLRIVIGKDGLVKKLDAVSGEPMLVPSAITAVSQWMYRPYYRDGEPQEVETLVVVEFSLADNTRAADF
jgi:protein TonB